VRKRCCEEKTVRRGEGVDGREEAYKKSPESKSVTASRHTNGEQR
jgi:hypothetical protein